MIASIRIFEFLRIAVAGPRLPVDRCVGDPIRSQTPDVSIGQWLVNQ
jgi:hypothetical protein